MISRLKISVPDEQIAGFCRHWRISELAIFGSAIRDDFRPDSDVDVLVTFAPDSTVSLLDWGPMMDELGRMFGRPVHLVEKSAIKNPLRRQSILRDYEVLYAT